MKFYPLGKDKEIRACIELDDGSLHVALELMVALIKALDKKNLIKQKDIQGEV